MKVYWYCILLFIEKNSLVAEAVFKHLSQLCRKENIWPYQRNDIWAYTYYCLNFKKISQYWIATASTGICSKCRCCLGMKKKDVGWRGVRENMIEKDPYWWHMVLVPSGCWFVKSSRVIRQDVLVWYIYSNSDSIQCICYNYLWSGRMCQIDGDTGGKWFTLVVFLVMQQESGRKALKGGEPSGRHTVVWEDLGWWRP